MKTNRKPSKQSYFEHVRSDLVKHIPTSASRILEIGCGAGATANAIRNQRSKELTLVGVEIDPEAAERATKIFNKVIVGPVDDALESLKIHEFDVILYGDVLEHLVNPWQTVKEHAKLLSMDGKIIASIPNIAYFKVIQMLKRGEWTYEDAGIMDRTHLRFFTRSTMIDLFHEADLDVMVVDKVWGGNKVKRSLMRLLPKRFSDRYVQQFILIAEHRRE